MSEAGETYALALAALHAGDAAECADLALQALEQRPGFGGAHLLRAVSAPADDRVLAAAHHLAACRHSPNDAEAWFNYGVLLQEHGRLEEAMDCYRRATLLDPTHSGALINGTQLIRIHEHFAEALMLARRLVRLMPESPLGYTHEAIALQNLGRIDEADVVFAKAETLTDDPAHLRWEHHFSLLATQRFAEAWERYETRFSPSVGNGVEDFPFDLPRWDNSADNDVLVYGEQGLGDQMMFACAVSDMQAACKKMTLAVAPELVDLFAASFPQVAVLPIPRALDAAGCRALVAQAGAEHPVDAVLAIGSLMTHFRNDRASYTGAPYLQPSAKATRLWDREWPRLRPHGTGKGRPLQLGLCWASNPAPELFHSSRRARHKTMPLDIITPLACVPDLEAVAITNVPLDAFVGHPAKAGIITDVSADLVNLDRTAALLKNLDLLITVDTGVAHLAGALGVPVWILLHSAGDARWGLPGAEDIYWYDSARLYWQEEPGDWFGLIARVRSDLERLTAAHMTGEVA